MRTIINRVFNYQKKFGTASLIKRIIIGKPFLEEISNFSRELISRVYIKGSGIEIGGLHNPLFINKNITRVKYVDRMQLKELRQQYPDQDGVEIGEPDIIADGEKLDPIENDSQDFVIANHFLEHCQNPVLAIKNMLRVLKKDGIIFMAIPDKRYTFDIKRPVTTLQHILSDYSGEPEYSKEEHFNEFVRLTENLKTEEEINQRLEYLLKIDYSIHYHVWTNKEMNELFLYLSNELNFPFEIEFMLANPQDIECIYILRKKGL
jgi:SAM-dependent methyltransferase